MFRFLPSVVSKQHNQRRHVTMGCSALTAKLTLRFLLIRTLRLQLLHMMNMMGSTYNVVQMQAKSIFDKTE
jgi:hypothetical protein